MDLLTQLASALHLDSGRVALLTVILAFLGRAFASLRQGGGLIGLWRSIVYGQNVPKVIADDYKEELKSKPPSSGGIGGMASLLALAAILGVFGMGLTGCATMDASGPYKGDKALYVTDLTLTTSYTVLDKFVTFEYQNRDALIGQPAIRKAADNIRMNAPKWFQDVEIARDAYAANPVSANLTAMQNAVQVIQAAISAASSYMIANPQLIK